MLKIIYTSEPFYSEVGGFNEPVTKELAMTFENDSSSGEIIAEMVKLLEFMGYSRQTKSSWLQMVDDLTFDGYLINDTKEEEKEN